MNNIGFLGRCGHYGLGNMIVSFGLGDSTDVYYVTEGGGLVPVSAGPAKGPTVVASSTNLPSVFARQSRKKKRDCGDAEE